MRARPVRLPGATGRPVPAAVGVLVAAAVAVVALAGAAGAHPRFEPFTAEPGRRVSLALLVDSHFADPLVSVEVHVPPELALQEVRPAPGWRAEPGTAPVRFTGTLPPGRLASFIVVVVPGERGLVHVPLTTRSAGGEEHRWDGDCRTDAPYKAAFLFVGVEPGCDPEPPGSGGLLTLRNVGFALIGVAVLLGLGYPVLQRRRQVLAGPSHP